LRRYKQILDKVRVFQTECVTLIANFRWKGTSPTNLCWYQKTRVTTLSCGKKISTVCSFILSQNTWVTDRQSERITIPRTALA